MLKRSETYSHDLNYFNRTNDFKSSATTITPLPVKRSSSTSALIASSSSPLASPRICKTRSHLAMSINNANFSAPTSTSHKNTQNTSEQLKVEYSSPSNRIRLTAHELSASLNLNKFSTMSKNESNKMKGMTVGKMILMSNGERTKQFENRMQDRLLNKQLESIQKQATQIEIQMKRARSLILDEYIQTKATNSALVRQRTTTNTHTHDQKPPLPTPKQTINTSTYLPSYLKSTKQKQLINYDYEEQLERHKKVSLNNRSVCSRHKRHLLSGEFHLNDMTYEEMEKFKEQFLSRPLMQQQDQQTQQQQQIVDVQVTTDLQQSEPSQIQQDASNVNFE